MLMLMLLLTFAGLSLVIIAAAMLLARCGDQIAEQTGLGGSMTGLILLAGATSLPELSVGYSAVKLQAADLTAGGVLGSSLVNLLILALIDLISWTPGKILSRTSAAHALSATVSMLLTAIIVLGLVLDTPWSLLRLGPISWAVIVMYGLCARLIFLDQRESNKLAAAEIPAEELQPAMRTSGSLGLNIAGFMVATAVIFVVAPYLAAKADTIADVTGLGRTFVGTLLLAGVTSLPEAVSTIAAVRLGAVDMAIANIFGSNAFNMVILASLDTASETPLLGMVSDAHAITGACVIITTSIALLCILYRVEKRWWLLEPDAALMAILILGSLYLVYLYG